MLYSVYSRVGGRNGNDFRFDGRVIGVNVNDLFWMESGWADDVIESDIFVKV